MFAMTLGKEIARMFSGMNVTSAVLFAVGLMLIITEFYRPLRGLGYGCGAVITALAIVLRMLSDAGIGTLFLMLLIAAFVLLAAHLLMLALHKREWLLLSTGIADDDGSDTEYSYLVGLRGVTTTAVNPSGHMSINDINFYVSADEYIEQGIQVTVKQVSGANIIVERVED